MRISVSGSNLNFEKLGAKEAQSLKTQNNILFGLTQGQAQFTFVFCRLLYFADFKMFEARILQGALLKKIIEAIRELVVDANLDCNERGITMQVFHMFINVYFFI